VFLLHRMTVKTFVFDSLRIKIGGNTIWQITDV
jgi:hypothetical protein